MPNMEEIIRAFVAILFRFQDHVWYAEAQMLVDSPYGSLSGVLSTTFDPASGQALFPDLNVTGFGTFYVQFRAYSDPADYNITLNHKMFIINPAHIGMTIEETYEVKVLPLFRVLCCYYF